MLFCPSFYIYPSSLYTTLDIMKCFEYNWLNNYIENISDRDLCIITDPYTEKNEYRIHNILFKNYKDLDINLSGVSISNNSVSDNDSDSMSLSYTNFSQDGISDNVPAYIDPPGISGSKIGVFVDDISHLMVYTNDTWKRIKLPVVSDIFNRKDPPKTLSFFCKELSDNKVFLNKLKMPERYYNFIRFFLYIPAHTKAILPKIDYTCRIKHY